MLMFDRASHACMFVPSVPQCGCSLMEGNATMVVADMPIIGIYSVNHSIKPAPCHTRLLTGCALPLLPTTACHRRLQLQPS